MQLKRFERSVWLVDRARISDDMSKTFIVKMFAQMYIAFKKFHDLFRVTVSTTQLIYFFYLSRICVLIYFIRWMLIRRRIMRIKIQKHLCWNLSLVIGNIDFSGLQRLNRYCQKFNTLTIEGKSSLCFDTMQKRWSVLFRSVFRSAPDLHELPCTRFRNPFPTSLRTRFARKFALPV